MALTPEEVNALRYACRFYGMDDEHAENDPKSVLVSYLNLMANVRSPDILARLMVGYKNST